MNMGHVAVGYLVMDQCVVTVELWHRKSRLMPDISPKSFTTKYRLAMNKHYPRHRIWQDSIRCWNWQHSIVYGPVGV